MKIKNAPGSESTKCVYSNKLPPKLRLPNGPDFDLRLNPSATSQHLTFRRLTFMSGIGQMLHFTQLHWNP